MVASSSSSVNCGDPLFLNCDVPYVPKVCFNFVEDCEIPPPPPPIFDCEPPIPPPPEPPPLCPEIAGKIKVKSRRLSRCESSSDSAQGSITVSKTANCEFEIDIDLDVPVPQPPCPVIRGGELKVTTGYSSCISSSSSNFINVTPVPTCDPDAPCEFDINLDLFIPLPEPPCPIIKGGKVKITAGYSSCISSSSTGITVSSSSTPGNCPDDPGQCEFTIDLDLTVPIPEPPCPVIKPGKVKVTTGYSSCLSSGSNGITISSSSTPGTCEEPGECEFTIDLDIVVPIPEPPCPVIKGGKVKVTTGYSSCLSSGSNGITVSSSSTPGNCPDDPPECEFTIDLDLVVPIPEPPCPVIKGGTVKVVTAYSSCLSSASNGITVSSSSKAGNCPDDPPECEFIIDLDLVVPIPEPPCPVIKGGVVKLKTGYSSCLPSTGGTITVSSSSKAGQCPDDPPECEFIIDLDLAIPIPEVPCPKIYASGSIKYGSSATIKVSASSSHVDPACDNQPAECNFDINIDIEVPEPICASIWTSPGGATVTPIPFGQEPKIVPKFIKSPDPAGDPTTSRDCDFEFQIDLQIPEPVCPSIWTSPGGATVTPIPFGQEPKIVPKFIKSPDPAGDPNTSRECDFEFQIDLQIPEPVCPSIWSSPGGATVTYIKAGEEPTITPKFIKSPDPNGDPNSSRECDHEFQIDLKIPEPCTPEYEPLPATVANGKILFADEPYLELFFDPYPEPDQCKVKVQPYLWVVKSAKVTKGDIQCDWTTCGGTPTCDVTIDEELNESGMPIEYKLNIDIKIPKYPTISGGSIDLGSYGSGSIDVGTDECNPMITGSITLNTGSCGSGGGGGGGTGSLMMPPDFADAQPFTAPPAPPPAPAPSKRKVPERKLGFSRALVEQFISEVRKNKNLRDTLEEILLSMD